MRELSIWIEGEPIPWTPPRVTRHGTYSPRKMLAWQRAVALQVQAKHKRAPCTEPCRLELTFFRTPPASWSAKRRNEARLGQIHPSTKPDLTNLLKVVEDALQGIVYVGDQQVVETLARKRYGVRSGVQIDVRTVPGRAAR